MKASARESHCWRTAFDNAQKKERILEIEIEVSKPEFWNDRNRALRLSQELSALKEEKELFEKIFAEWQDLSELAKISSLEEKDLPRRQAGLSELEQQTAILAEKVKNAELQVFLSEKYDRGNAVLTITAGAGGQDAQDWVALLFRMYERYCAKKNWNVKVLHESFGDPGPEGRIGIKQVTFEAAGTYAYGFLKKENGVHRLVRISPFSAKALRHTSFAALEVLPKIDAAQEHIEIRPEDIQVEMTRSSGPGGQNVNKRETAVRMVHIPTGIVVESQTQRSQQQNKEKALEILAAKLYLVQQQARAQELASLKGKQSSIEWGSQIRSYVLAPYQLVKDHRTNAETSNTQAVLNGELDEFIEAELTLKNG
ncbi:MAG: peptide chain release factor 2 [bacterium]|nr:peptide chain release factor 2 [bacterium]